MIAKTHWLADYKPKLLRSEARLLSWFFESAQKPPVRPIYQFACDEVVIPEGKFKGRRYKPERQPFSALLLHEIDRGYWRRFATTGCVQSGKTFSSLVIPFLWHIFEIQEDVIVGVPEMESAFSKWSKEFLPAIKRVPKFAEQLPDSGKGSKGGKFESLQFKHGPIVRFMSGQGGDEKRSGETARVVMATEVDKYDTAGEASRETDPVSQMEARTESYEDDARIYLECTVSVPSGRIWQEYENGSQSRIACPCPHCGNWVTPEKEQFTAHSSARSEIQAETLARFDCPDCGENISEERPEMNRSGIVVHKGQEVAGDEIQGGLPETRTLGFRWNAFNNLFWSVPYLGRKEWEAENGLLAEDEDEESGSKKSIQFRWTKPYEILQETVELKYHHVQKRILAADVMPRGKKPEDTKLSIIGVDVNRPVLHWTATAFRQQQSAHIFDYGTTGTDARRIGFEEGIKKALFRLREILGSGWSDQEYDMVLVDCRWKGAQIMKAMKLLKDRRFVPYLGMGSGHIINQKYTHPKKTVKDTILWIGDNCYVRWDGKNKYRCLQGDANYYKTDLAERFQIEGGEDAKGSISIFGSTNEHEHRNFYKHLSAEKQVQRFEKGKGWKLVWDPVRTANHHLDSTYMTLVGANRKGFSFGEKPKPANPQGQTVVTESSNQEEQVYRDGGSFRFN